MFILIDCFAFLRHKFAGQFEDALEESTEEQKNGDNPNENSEPPVNKISKDAKPVLTEISDRQNVNSIDKRPANLDDSPKAVDKPDKIVSRSRADVIRDKISKFSAFTIAEDGIEKCILSACELNKEFFKDEFDFVTAFCEINYDKNIFYSLIYGTST